MNVTILKDHLEKSVTTLSRIISQKAQLPILSNILLEATKGEITLSATNLNESIRIALPAKVEEEGTLSVPGKTFSEFVHLLPQKPITLTTKNQTLTVVCEHVKADFNGIAAQEFPKLPVFTETSFSLANTTIAELVSLVSFAASKDEGRPVLTGALLRITDNTIMLVATDGFRLSLAKSVFKEGGKEQQVLLPAKTLEEIVRITKDFAQKTDDVVLVSLLEEQNQLVFRIGPIDFSTRLLEGQYPDWQRVIPNELGTRVVLAREDFLNAVRLASVFSRDSLSVIKIDVTADGLVLASDAKEIGNDVIRLDAEVEGEGGEIAFNPRFLLEFLQTLPSDSVQFEMSGPLAPAVFRKDDKDTFLHVIMPVRT